MARVTNEDARKETEQKWFEWNGKRYEVGFAGIIVYDDIPTAEAMGRLLGVEVKHANNKHEGHWKTFSVVLRTRG